jgi:hypothetical protein
MFNNVVYYQYCQVCQNAIENDIVFKNFKNIPEYIRVLEHVDFDLGNKYIEIIKKQNSFLLSKELIEKYKENDLVGNPIKYDFEYGKMSATIFRYVKVLSDLILYFGDLSNKKIIEIGPGNCGQVNIISKLYSYLKYDVIDLPVVMELQKKCINVMQTPNIGFKKIEDLDTNEQYDMVISNYAFSECDFEYKEKYLNNIILNSKQGYLTMNCETIAEYKSYLLNRLKDKNPQILNEEPLSYNNNYIIIWK